MVVTNHLLFIDCISLVRTSLRPLRDATQTRSVSRVVRLPVIPAFSSASVTRTAIAPKSKLPSFQTYLHNFGYITANALILYFALFINSAKTPLRYLCL